MKCEYYGKFNNIQHCFSVDYSDDTFDTQSTVLIKEAKNQLRFIYSWLSENAGPDKQNIILAWLFGKNKSHYKTYPSMYGLYIYINDDTIAAAFKLRFV